MGLQNTRLTLQDSKSGHKWQSQTMSKIETTSKVSLKLTSKINLGRQGARNELSILDTAYKPIHSLERVKALI